MSLYDAYKNYGRKIIYTDARFITAENVLQELERAMITHEENASVCDFLINYEAGNQPIEREKAYRSDIDCECVDNIANQITEFKTAYNYGNVITFVARGTTDSGIIDDEPSAITLFNECYESEFVREKTQELARYIPSVILVVPIQNQQHNKQDNDQCDAHHATPTGHCCQIIGHVKVVKVICGKTIKQVAYI